jgi:DNA polymerase-3 subunit gamma/tau
MSVLPLFGADDAAPAIESVRGSALEPAAAPTVDAPRPVDQIDTPPASQSLYRKYRPQSFDADDLVGQEHVVRTLRNAIRLNRVAHAYLFCGPRGTGKTTTARLVAKAVNCLDPDPDRRPCNACANCLAISSGRATDVIEIDAASNRGIDDIRDLRERVKYAPTQLPYKFYIVDEAHQITGAAANAFLKTLEEPPAHTKFVLATTDPEELLPTIVSRCQRFDFRRISHDAMAARLRTVAAAEGISIDDAALDEIARLATGSLRDALGLLDQLALHGGIGGDRPVGDDDVRALLGISRNDRVEALIRALTEGDPGAALTAVNEAVDAGEDPRQLNRQLVAALRLRMQDVAAGRGSDADDPRLSMARLAALLRRFGEVDYKIRHSPYAHLPLEVALVEAMVEAAEPTAATTPITPSRHAEPAAIRTRAQAEFDPGQPSTRLRSRVRGDAAPVPAPLQSHPEGATERAGATDANDIESAPVSTPGGLAPVEPAAEARTVAPTPGRARGSGGGDNVIVDVGQLADLWPRIRQDVKALNRRAEALLTEADPARVAGTRITLATPYEFHREKLNSDVVRDLLETVIGRLVGCGVSVEAVLTADLPARDALAAAASPATSAQPSAAPIASSVSTRPVRLVPPNPDEPVQDAPPPTDEDRSRADERLEIARNVFDADIVDNR